MPKILGCSSHSLSNGNETFVKLNSLFGFNKFDRIELNRLRVKDRNLNINREIRLSNNNNKN